MLAVLLAFRYLSFKRLWQKCLVVLICAALLIPLSFKSFDWLSSLMSQVSEVLISQVYGEQGDESVSGVDLNDEASNLMVYQKAYTAACRLMTTLNDALDSLLAM